MYFRFLQHFLFFTLLTTFINANETAFSLSGEEKIHLSQMKSINACINPHWMPFSSIEEAKHTGISADFIKLFEIKLGIPINIYQTSSWSQSIGFTKAKKCDILSMAIQTDKREKYLNFTEPYFYFSNAIVTRSDKATFIDLEHMKNVKIAIIRDYAEIERFQSKYVNIEIVEVESIVNGLAKVKNEEAYGFIDNAFVIDAYFQENEKSDFKIGNYFADKSYLRVGVRDDDRKLYHIFEKLIKSISLKEKEIIRTKYLDIAHKQKADYQLFYELGFFILLMIIAIMYRYFNSKALNKELTRRVDEALKKSKDKDKMIFHQSKLVAMGEMIENIAHQWRQPLSQVNSCVLVIDDILDEKRVKNSLLEEKLEEIESLTKYMSNTIEDFKNFFDQSKIKSTFVIENIIDKSLDILSGRLLKYGIKVSRGLATEHLCEGYPSELQQAIISIIANAIDIIALKEIKNGKITIDVNLRGEMNIIMISDNAGGVASELIEKIFEPYYTTKHKSQGTGLGLYIAKIIIEDSLDGKLSVKNNFSGASFIIKLRDTIQRKTIL